MKTHSTFFRDRSGKIVIMQFPNWPIWVALALNFVSWLGNDTLTLTSQWLTKAILLYWSYLEIRFGVNGFRKSLGVLVALSQIMGVFRK